ncbi:MAG: Uma2 family endonuclease [Peptococcaceae bacterium]|nr:Uma2 family endonuclease [Peptococcaceae bacterium]
MNVANPLKLYTVEEFEQMEKEEHLTYELIDGVVMMSPRPAKTHQNISGNLYFEMRNALKHTNCKPLQEVDLALNHDIMVPDIMVLCNDNMQGTRQTTPPLIVVEIVSPSSSGRDYMLKRLKYQQLGIEEYWIVSPEEKCIWVIHYAEQAEHHYCDGEAKSAVLLELVIDLEQIFV